MPFWSDVLRVGGFIVAPALMATGVGAPLALGIGAVAAGAGNAGADAVERADQNNRADAAAEQARRDADARIRQQEEDARLAQAQRQREIQQQLDLAALPGRAIAACQGGNVNEFVQLLPRLTTEQFTALGMTPLAACTTQEARQQVLQAIQNERQRRGL